MTSICPEGSAKGSSKKYYQDVDDWRLEFLVARLMADDDLVFM